MFSIFDSKAGTFSPPFFMLNVGSALRSFADVANDRETMIFRHPEDYSLFLLGEFDDLTGEVKMEKHENLGTAASYRKPSVIPFGNAQDAISFTNSGRLLNAEEVVNGKKEEVVQ